MIYTFDHLSFQILAIDRFFHDNGTYEVKARPHAALSFRVSGTGTFRAADKCLTVTPGDVLFIPAGMPYKADYSVSESIVAHLTDCSYAEAEIFSPENGTPIRLAFECLLQEWNTHHSVNLAKSAIYGILDKMANDKKGAFESTSFAACLRYMEAHFHEPTLDISEIRERGFISASGLQRAFKEQLGLSPKQYLDRLRMNRALELLAENALRRKQQIQHSILPRH